MADHDALDSTQTGKKTSRTARTVWACVIGLLTIHAGLLAWSATRHSPTLNEPGHLVAGLSYWQFGRFELYRVNPPLVEMIAALPVMAAGYQEDWSGFHESPGARPVFAMGSDFIKANGERSIWLFTIARWACIPISLAGGLFCFLWSRELWSVAAFDPQSKLQEVEQTTSTERQLSATTNGGLAGLISLTLWCFEPNILAHGELVTPDCAATAFGLGAAWTFWRWLKQPTWGRAFAAGALLGLAELSKMTWVILFALWPLLWLFWSCTRTLRAATSFSPAGERFSQPANSGTPEGWMRVRATRFLLSTFRSPFQLTTILLVGLYILNLGYAFDGTFTQLKEFTFISRALTGLEESGEPGNRFADSVLGELPVPLPKQYLLGMDVQKHDFEDYGQPSYLRGEWKDGGWWYYYIYGLAVKTPHGSQLLLLVSIVTFVWFARRRQQSQHGVQRVATWRDVVILLAPATVVMVLVSSQMEFNHHVRYVLPVLGFVFVFCGVTSHWFCARPTKSKPPL